MPIKEHPDTYRTTATVVGLIYLGGMVVGITGNILIQSILGASDPLSKVPANGMKIAIGAILWLLTVAGDAAHGILMFPVLKRHSERMAIGYLGSRIVDAVFIGVHVLFVLLQIPLGKELLKAGAADASPLHALSAVFIRLNLYGYHFAMTALGVAGLILCYGFYRSRLVPRFVAVWGLLGYATILCGSVLEVSGFDLRSVHAIPGGLWELFIGVRLIAKGFDFSAGSKDARAEKLPEPVASGLYS